MITGHLAGKCRNAWEGAGLAYTQIIVTRRRLSLASRSITQRIDDALFNTDDVADAERRRLTRLWSAYGDNIATARPEHWDDLLVYAASVHSKRFLETFPFNLNPLGKLLSVKAGTKNRHTCVQLVQQLLKAVPDGEPENQGRVHALLQLRARFGIDVQTTAMVEFLEGKVAGALDITSHNFLLQAFAANSNAAGARHWLAVMSSRTPDLYNQETLFRYVSALVKGGELDEAQSAVEEMSSLYNITPNVATRAALVAGYAAGRQFETAKILTRLSPYPECMSAWLSGYTCLSDLNTMAQAAQFCVSASPTAANSSQVHSQLIKSFYNMREYRACISQLQKALELGLEVDGRASALVLVSMVLLDSAKDVKEYLAHLGGRRVGNLAVEEPVSYTVGRALIILTLGEYCDHAMRLYTAINKWTPQLISPLVVNCALYASVFVEGNFESIYKLYKPDDADPYTRSTMMLNFCQNYKGSKSTPILEFVDDNKTEHLCKSAITDLISKLAYNRQFVKLTPILVAALKDDAVGEMASYELMRTVCDTVSECLNSGDVCSRLLYELVYYTLQALASNLSFSGDASMLSSVSVISQLALCHLCASPWQTLEILALVSCFRVEFPVEFLAEACKSVLVSGTGNAQSLPLQPGKLYDYLELVGYRLNVAPIDASSFFEACLLTLMNAVCRLDGNGARMRAHFKSSIEGAISTESLNKRESKLFAMLMAEDYVIPLPHVALQPRENSYTEASKYPSTRPELAANAKFEAAKVELVSKLKGETQRGAYSFAQVHASEQTLVTLQQAFGLLDPAQVFEVFEVVARDLPSPPSMNITSDYLGKRLEKDKALADVSLPTLFYLLEMFTLPQHSVDAAKLDLVYTYTLKRLESILCLPSHLIALLNVEEPVDNVETCIKRLNEASCRSELRGRLIETLREYSSIKIELEPVSLQLRDSMLLSLPSLTLTTH